MTTHFHRAIDSLVRDVRLFVFGRAAVTGRVLQPSEIASALQRPQPDIREALDHLAAGKVLILAPNSGAIWAANPFCAVPSAFRVEAGGTSYQGICIWDAMGIAAALGKDAVIKATCGDCGDAVSLEIRDGSLIRGEGVVHFGVPARHWWDNIGFT